MNPSTNNPGTRSADLRLVRRLAPYEGGTPFTKEQVKRRTFWINLFIITWSIGLWVVAALIAVHQARNR